MSCAETVAHRDLHIAVAPRFDEEIVALMQSHTSNSRAVAHLAQDKTRKRLGRNRLIAQRRHVEVQVLVIEREPQLLNKCGHIAPLAFAIHAEADTVVVAVVANRSAEELLVLRFTEMR